MKETTLGKQIQIKLVELGARLWRNNVAFAWVSNSVEQIRQTKTVVVHAGDVVLRQGRPIHTGLCTGSADYIGITPEGKFLSVEIKTKTGIIKADQHAWLEMIKKNNGIAMVARTVEEAEEKYKNW